MLNTKALAREFRKACQDQRTRAKPGAVTTFLESFNEGLETRAIRMEDVSFRRLIEDFLPGGAEMIQSWGGGHGISGGVSFSAFTDRLLMEEQGAVTFGAFSNITGQIIYNRILQGFTQESFVFTPLVEHVPTAFNGERIAGVSHIGDVAEGIGEGKQYPMAGVSEDWIDTPQTVKRGLMDALTKEAVFFDRTALVVNRCQEVGEYLGVNKEKRIIDACIDQNVTTHRYKWKGTTYGTYQTTTPWVNVSATTGLVDWTSIDKLEQVGQKILDPYTNEPVFTEPVDMIVARQNLYLARHIIRSTTVNIVTPGFATTLNPNMSQGPNLIEKNYRILSSNLLGARTTLAGSTGNLTDWFLGDVNKAVKYMENWPLQVAQAPANNLEEFQRDIVMQWKAGERGAASVQEPRLMLKATV